MTNNCLEVQDNLSAWLDGELAPEVMMQVERHLEGCAGCRRELALLTALDQALGSSDGPGPRRVAGEGAGPAWRGPPAAGGSNWPWLRRWRWASIWAAPWLRISIPSPKPLVV